MRSAEGFAQSFSPIFLSLPRLILVSGPSFSRSFFLSLERRSAREDESGREKDKERERMRRGLYVRRPRFVAGALLH